MYRNQDVISLRIGDIYNATEDYVKIIYYFDFNELNSSLSDFISILMEKSRNLFDASVDFELYSDEEWSFSLTGWRNSTDEEKELYKNALEISKQEREQRAL